jgi:uncharacterized protein (TIGR03086 family)
MTENTDPRPFYDRALAWAQTLVEGVRPEQLADATPCAEFDVRALLGHLVATVRRACAIGEGRPPFSVPSTLDGVADDAWAAALAEAVTAMRPVWADDALLDKEVAVPWGSVPGRAALWGYVNEALVHGWDLAVATGQPSEADQDVAEAALGGSTAHIPARMRGEGIPFDAVVEPAPGAGPTERLANWSGHRRR